MKMMESSLKVWKPLWEKKLPFTSHFSFSHSIFNRLVPQKCKNTRAYFGKGLKLGKCDEKKKEQKLLLSNNVFTSLVN